MHIDTLCLFLQLSHKWSTLLCVMEYGVWIVNLLLWLNGIMRIDGVNAELYQLLQYDDV